MILGGLSALYQITGERAQLDQALSISDAALQHLTTPPDGSAGPPGVLVEPRELAAAPGDGDMPQFKGIFVRNLSELYRLTGRPAYRAFILANACSIWDNARNPANQFGLRWTGPFDRADASRQSSALDALNAALAVTGPGAGEPGAPG